MSKRLDPPGSRQKKGLNTAPVESYSNLGEIRKLLGLGTHDTTIGKSSQQTSSESEKPSRIDSDGLSALKGSIPPSESRNPNTIEPGKPGGNLEVGIGPTGAPKFRRAKPAFSGAEKSTSKNALSFLINEHKSSQPYLTRTYEKFIVNGKTEKIGEKIERFQVAKIVTQELQKYLTSIDPDRAAKLNYCGSYLWLREFLSYGEGRLKGGIFCGQPRLCQPCAIRRSSRLLRELVHKVFHVLSTVNKPGAGSLPILPHLVTFTVKDGADLKERYQHLDSSIRTMAERARRYRNNPRNIRNEWGAAAGVFLTHEFKRGSGSGLWHPHSHCLWLSELRPNVDNLRDEWYDLTGDSFMVDVRPLDCTPKIYDAIHSRCWNPDYLLPLLAGDLVEVCKYTLKMSGLSPVDAYQAFQSLSGLHMVRTYGSLYGINPAELQVSSESETDLDGPFIDHILQWQQNHYITKTLRTDAGTVQSINDAVNYAAIVNPVKRVKIG